VPDASAQAFGNPLRVRRALDHGVRVVVAHCASLGTNVDLDQGPSGPRRPNIELFGRLMAEPRYERLLYGDVSAVTQINRMAIAFPLLLERQEWHSRLLFGSDYPLPGVMPLISPRRFAARGFLPRAEVAVLDELQGYNPLLFDFVLKRRLAADGNRFAPAVFRTRSFFARPAA
jgi:mannonate dehydratase